MEYTGIIKCHQSGPVPGLLSQKEAVTVHEADQSAQRLAAKVLEISTSVTVAYYELFYAHQALAIHHEQVTLANVNLGMAGQWDLTIEIQRPGQPVKETFSIIVGGSRMSGMPNM